ncbi:MAG: YeiH family protein [Halanaerobiales bacterium]
MKKTSRLIPGILFLFFIGIISKYIGGYIPHISYLIIAIALGIVSANFFNLPAMIEDGIVNTHKLWLKTGIVILGARVILKDLIEVGPTLLMMIMVFIFFSLICVEFLSSKFGLENRLGSCLASGTSVCGVSAVIATGGAIQAKKNHIAYGIATVLLFDIITVFSYPLIGQVFAIPAEVFGPWAGISMFSTGTTVAAGFAHSAQAGQLATMAKMGRNVFIGIWALIYSLYYVKKGLNDTMVENKAAYLWEKFPKIIIGFAAMLIIANSGILDESQIASMKNAYNWLFMMAFVGLGYTIDFDKLKKTGIKPFLTVLISFVLISIICLVSSYMLFA